MESGGRPASVIMSAARARFRSDSVPRIPRRENPEAGHVPLRRCAACGLQAPKGELVRVSRTSQGVVAIDPQGKRGGRGAYLCPREACWKAGLDRGRIDAVLRHRLTQEERQGLRRALERSQEESA